MHSGVKKDTFLGEFAHSRARKATISWEFVPPGAQRNVYLQEPKVLHFPGLCAFKSQTCYMAFQTIRAFKNPKRCNFQGMCASRSSKCYISRTATSSRGFVRPGAQNTTFFQGIHAFKSRIGVFSRELVPPSSQCYMFQANCSSKSSKCYIFLGTLCIQGPKSYTHTERKEGNTGNGN